MFGIIKYHWQNAIKSLLIIAGFGAYSAVNADHILGGEISYTNISAKKYKFQLRMYRNCNSSCEFNSGNCADIKNLDVYASPDVLNYALKLSTIPLTRISRKDITPLCSGVQTKCNSGNFPEGIEEWLWEGFIDFDTINPDYCQLEISVRVDSREDVFSKGSEAFYNFARLNICGGLRNNSPKYQAPAYYLLLENQSFTYNILAQDQDGDSLSFEMVNAAKAWNTGISYGTGYSGQKPLDIYCPAGNCNLDRTSWPVGGIGLDPESGWLGFTPITANQESFLVVEVTEWRKSGNSYTKVGVSRRDIQLKVISPANNPPKISTSALSYNACAGQDFMLDFGVMDQLYGSTKDSVSFFIYSDLPGFVAEKVKGSAKNQFDAFVSIPIKNSQIRKKPYYITIVVVDDHCPLLASNYVTLEVYVNGVPGKSAVIQYTRCDEISYSSSVSGSEYSQSWFLSDSAGMLDTRTGTGGTFEVPRPGKYYIVHQVSNSLTGCITENVDSVVVPYFSLMKENMNWPQKVCSNEEFTLNAGFNGGSAPFQYWWNGVYGSNSQLYKISKDSVIRIRILDNRGCELIYNKTLSLFNRAQTLVTDTSMCLPVYSNKLNLNNRISVIPGFIPENLDIQYSGSGGWFSKSGTTFHFEPNSAQINDFGFTYTDSHNCHYSGNFRVTVIDPLPTGIVTPAPICSNAEQADLEAITGCQVSGGLWDCNANPQTISGKLFDPAVSGPGSFEIHYTKNLDGCLIRDTVILLVNRAPDVSITKPADPYFCESSPDFNLSVSPPGGSWSNDAGLPATARVVPALIANKGSAIYSYSYTDPSNLCASSDSLTLYVNRDVVLNITQPLEVCESSGLELNPDPKYTQKLALTGELMGIGVKRYDDRFILTPGDVKIKEQRLLSWLATALPGCKDQKRDFILTIKPIPEISLTSDPNRGCSPLQTSLKVENLNPDAAPDAYLWREGLDWVQGSDIKPVKLVTAGEYPFIARAGLEGCLSEPAFVSIRVLASPDVAFNVDPASRTITTDFTHAGFTDRTTCSAPFALKWEFEKGMPATSTKSRVGVDFPPDTGLYLVKLTVTTDSGCVASVQQSIRVRPGLQFYAPNIFTPDGKGPGENEVFRIFLDSTSSFHLTIRNRWGEIVFMSNKSSDSWNGRYLGEDAPAGVYIWEVEANTIYGSYVRRAGSVTLIR